MSSNVRIIPAELAQAKGIEAFPFPYFAATFEPDLQESHEEDDDSIGSQLTSVAEETQRLASVDQQIFRRMQQAETEAQEIARKAYEEGFSAGEREGRAFGESQYRAYLQRLETHLQELQAQMSLVGKAAEEELLALVLACAEHLAGREIHLALDGARPLLEGILAAYPDLGATEEQKITVLLHPRDLELLGNAFTDRAHLILAEDPELARGSLRLKAPDGILEATLERRRQRLVGVVERWREAGGAP